MTVQQSAWGARSPEIWGRIPPRNKNFTGREELLGRLRAGITGEVTAVVPTALHGFGGVGKTLLAVEYAYRYRGDYDLVWWVPADQPVLVRSSLASLAPFLGLPPVTATGIEDAANAVLNALRRGEPYAKWLLIFDNADQPEDINDIIPRGPGHVIITSRNPRWDSVVDTVPVDVFAPEESVEFLNKRVRHAISAEEAKRLGEALGHLPLALEQAGALLAETGLSVEEYLRLLEERTKQLLSEGKPPEYPLSMTAAWALSVEKLREKAPEAVELLRLCAFFGPEPIPRDVFSQSPPGLNPQLARLLGDPIGLTRVVGELGRFALARIDPSTRTLQVHRLIQALVRDELTDTEQEQARHEVHRLLAAAAPESPSVTENWDRYSNLLSHVLPSGVADCQDPVVRQLAQSMVRYLYVRGEYASARSFSELFVSRWTAQSGADNLDVLNARRTLGIILRQLGEYTNAHEYNRETLAKLEEVAGPDDENVLLLINSIGADLRAAGDFRKALEHDEASLRRHQLVFSADHPSTLLVQNNLALDYGLVSNYVRSRELHELTFRQQWPQVPSKIGRVDVLNSWNGLARAVRLCGEYGQACDLGEDAYAYGVTELGIDHPVTLLTAKDLSIALRRAGRYDESLELAEQMHARYMRLLGENHPDSMAATMCLSNILRTVGEITRAAQLAEGAMTRYPQIYGPKHPYNHGCASNFAMLKRLLGDLPESRQLNERSLQGLEEMLGRDHHYSLTAATNLASDLAELGELDNAIALGRGTLRRLRTLLGADHPMTLTCAANLSVDLRQAGAEEDAEQLFQDTRDRYAATLGVDHPDAVVAIERRHLDADFDPPPI